MKKWYQDWFDSPGYLTVYNHRDQSEAEEFVITIVNKIELQPNDKILDMACGAGRHSIALAKRGFRVCGIDLSNKLLEKASKDAAELGVSIDFQRHDIRSLHLKNTFELVLNLFTSFGYFTSKEENFGIFQTAYEHVSEGKYFVFDYFNENYIRKNIIPFSMDTFDDCYIEQFRSIQENTVLKDIVIQSGNILKTYHESVQLYNPVLLQKEIERVGFSIVDILGDYQGHQFIKDFSPRFIAICKK